MSPLERSWNEGMSELFGIEIARLFLTDWRSLSIDSHFYYSLLYFTLHYSTLLHSFVLSHSFRHEASQIGQLSRNPLLFFFWSVSRCANSANSEQRSGRRQSVSSSTAGVRHWHCMLGNFITSLIKFSSFAVAPKPLALAVCRLNLSFSLSFSLAFSFFDPRFSILSNSMSLHYLLSS